MDIVCVLLLFLMCTEIADDDDQIILMIKKTKIHLFIIVTEFS